MEGGRSPQRRDPLDEEVEEGIGVDVRAHVRVRLRVGPAPEIDDRPSAAEIRLELDGHVPMPRLYQAGTDQVRDGDGIVDRRAVPAVGLAVVAREVDIEVGNEATHAPGCTQALLDV